MGVRRTLEPVRELLDLPVGPRGCTVPTAPPALPARVADIHRQSPVDWLPSASSVVPRSTVTRTADGTAPTLAHLETRTQGGPWEFEVGGSMEEGSLPALVGVACIHGSVMLGVQGRLLAPEVVSQSRARHSRTGCLVDRLLRSVVGNEGGISALLFSLHR